MNERFNSKAVSFLKNVFHSLLLPFSRIRLLDATSCLIPETFREIFHGSGGTRHTAGVKIQLEYDLLNGQFLNVDVGPEKGNDKTYGVTCSTTIQKRDLCLRDLGYFDLEELDHLEIQEAYYVSRLQVNTSLFIKNETPEVFYSTGEIKKHSKFTRVELEPFLTELKPGQTIELPKVYCGRSKRLECHLYGQLIALFVTSSTMYKMSHLLYTKHKMELSEYKGMSGSQKYLTPLFQSMQKSCQNIQQLLFRLFHFINKLVKLQTI